MTTAGARSSAVQHAGHGRAPATRVDEVAARLVEMVEDRRARGVGRLPTETQLSRELGASRNTVRAALSRLAASGEIERRRRVGTLISPMDPEASATMPWASLAYPVDLVQSVADFFVEADVPYAVRSVTLRHEAPDAAATEHLRLGEGELVYRVTRTYESRGTPAVLVEHSLPHTLNGHPVRISSLADGVTSFLHETQGIRLSRSEHRVTAINADPELAGALEVPVGAALLSVACKLFTKGDTPVAIGRLVFRPDQVCVRATATVVLSPPDPHESGVPAALGESP